jgi:hypothetical protein
MTLRMGAGPRRGPPVARPELAVPRHVLVISLPPGAPPRAAVEEWIRLEPDLREHDDALAELVEVAAGYRQPGDVAAFLMYGDVGGTLSGGTAVLTLEMVEPMSGSPAARARTIVDRLRAIARQIGHPDGTTRVEPRATAGGVAAARVRFVTVTPADDGEDCAPMVEVCRWLYPVPGHDDLVWSLCFQTIDLDRADELVAEFDALAGSLRWTGA